MLSLSYGVRSTKVTLRAHIYIVNTPRSLRSAALTALLLSSIACGHTLTRQESTALPEGVRLEVLSVVGKEPDTWRWLKKDPAAEKEILVREEFDLNQDRRRDLTREYENGMLAKVSMDLDFDGKPDRSELYQNGMLAKVEISHTFDGKSDTWRFYEKGALTRVERDTNRDGSPDEWMYFEGGKLRRTGRDYNFDGVVDTWEE